MNPDQARALRPEQRIKELGKQLELANQKAQFYETMVDVMKNDYGLFVTKKRLGKSSCASRSRGLSVSRACRLMNLSRQAYYQYYRSADQRGREDKQVARFVRQVRMRQRE